MMSFGHSQDCRSWWPRGDQVSRVAKGGKAWDCGRSWDCWKSVCSKKEMRWPRRNLHTPQEECIRNDF